MRSNLRFCCSETNWEEFVIAYTIGSAKNTIIIGEESLIILFDQVVLATLIIFTLNGIIRKNQQA